MFPLGLATAERRRLRADKLPASAFDSESPGSAPVGYPSIAHEDFPRADPNRRKLDAHSCDFARGIAQAGTPVPSLARAYPRRARPSTLQLFPASIASRWRWLDA